MLYIFSSQPVNPPPISITKQPGIVPTPTEDGPGAVEPSQNSQNINLTALIGSMITSITSLIGFLTTTIITWRKEKREASLADMERKRLETELEKSRLELEELKKNKEKRESRRKKS